MKKMCILAAVFALCVTAYAQRADFVTELLAADKATYGEVCYLSAVHQGFVDENASYEAALRSLVQRGQVVPSIDVNGAVTLQELSRLMAKMWDIKGGLMYRATKRSARYAFRQFKVDGVLSATADPSEKASGSDVLNIYTACLRKYGGAE